MEPLARRRRSGCVKVLLLAAALTLAAASTAVGVSRPIPVRSSVGCDLAVGTAEQPYGEAAIVLDRLGLPRHRYPWRVERSRDRAFPFWAKWGVLVRANTAETVTISVARPWRRHAVIGWGNASASSVRFLPCTSPSAWLAYAGGFGLKKRGCVPFDVEVGDRIERVRIGFGRSC